MPETPAASAANPDSGIDGNEYLRLIGLGAALGVPAALVASLFLAFVHVCETWLWTDLPNHLGHDSPPWYLVIGLPIVGAAVVAAARVLLPGDGGHPPLLGIGGGAVPVRYAPGVALAALGTLIFGAVLGPEAPLIALGSITGMVFAPLLRGRSGKTDTVLATAGSFSAVSALFGGPLVAGILLLEAGLGAGTALIPVLLPGVVAAAVGYLVVIGFGSWGGLNHAGLAVPHLPAYTGAHVLDMVMAIVVGVLAAAAIVPIRKLATRIDAVGDPRNPRRMPILLLAGGAAVGLLAWLAGVFGADTQEVLFSGQSAVPQEIVETSAGLLILVLIAKGLGYAVSLGCGFRGGPVFPSIFVGVGIASLAVIWFGTSPTWAVAVGTAAGMAAGTRFVFSSLLFSLLLTGTAGLDALPAAVLGATAAWLVRSAIEQRLAARHTATAAQPT